MSNITKPNLTKDNLDEYLVVSRDEAIMIDNLVSSIQKQMGVLNNLLDVSGLNKTYGPNPRKVSNLDIPKK